MSTFAPGSWTKEDLDALSEHVYPYLDDARRANYMTWVGSLAKDCMKMDIIRGNGTAVGSLFSTSFEPGHRADVHILPRHWSFYQFDMHKLRDVFMQQYDLKLLWAAIPCVPEARPAHLLAGKMGFLKTGLLPLFARHNGVLTHYVYYAYLRGLDQPSSVDSVEGSCASQEPPALEPS